VPCGLAYTLRLPRPLTTQALLVLAVMAGALVLFITEALAVNLVGLMVIVALILGGVLNPEEALGGFSNSAVVTIAAMFILSAGLIRAGTLDRLTRLMFLISKGSGKRLILIVMVTVAVSSAFLNNTPITVIFLPVVLGVAASFKLAPSKLLIPMSYASILGGTCTLIGTSTNLLVAQSAAQNTDYPMQIGMFDFTGPGIVFAIVGFTFLALLAPKLLPDRASVSGTTESGRIREFVTEIYFSANSPQVGKSYQESISKIPGITPLMLIRGDDVIFAPLVTDPRAQFVRSGDVLLLKGEPGSINALLERDGVDLPPELGALLAKQGAGKTMTMVELVINPNSPLIGRTIARSGFSRRHGGAAAIAVLRRDEHLRERVSEIRLRLGDTLLIVCEEATIDELRNSNEFILLEGIDRKAVRHDKAPIALSIMSVVVVLAALEVLPIVTLAVTGVALMVLTGCLSLRMAYNAIDMSIIMLIAGMLALGLALERTGIVDTVAQSLVGGLEAYGPRAMMAGLYLIAAVLTSMVSNNAVAVLVTPLAIETALGLGYSPEPFVFATLFGASASFATPIGYQTNLFVYAPGGYRFTDYMRIGIPLNLVLFVVALWVIPWFWPFAEYAP
jgi:di/tricarboxylate transporter